MAKMFRNKILYFKDIYKFPDYHFFIGVIFFVCKGHRTQICVFEANVALMGIK